MRDWDLVEDPNGMVIGSVEELLQGFGVTSVDFSVIDKVLASVLRVIRSGFLRQSPHQPQHLTVHS